jgi:hypothetical protein
MNSKLYWLYAAKEELLKLGVRESSICENINDNPDDPMVQCEMTEEQAQAMIPKDMLYCYKRENGEYKHCPFWDLVEHFPKQSNGFCHYLKQGDFTGDHFGLLWDSCKECGIGDDLPEGDY